ncbi:MAG: GNAT family N-acetyltransferase [Oscillospiraceae bacterium]|nr:GNAT family N-acetyltransferase [Oscillospiraceae bacterium]
MRLTLHTDRLLLRPFVMEDAEAMFSGWANDPEVTKYMTWDPHKDVEETRRILGAWIAQYDKPERLCFAIERREDGALIGGIDVVGYEDDGKTPVIGYDLSRSCWNRGYMTEACRCLVSYLFSQGFTQIRIDALPENIGSNRVIQKCGGELLCTEEEYFPLKQKTVRVNRYRIRK